MTDCSTVGQPQPQPPQQQESEAASWSTLCRRRWPRDVVSHARPNDTPENCWPIVPFVRLSAVDVFEPRDRSITASARRAHAPCAWSSWPQCLMPCSKMCDRVRGLHFRRSRSYVACTPLPTAIGRRFCSISARLMRPIFVGKLSRPVNKISDFDSTFCATATAQRLHNDPKRVVTYIRYI